MDLENIRLLLQVVELGSVQRAARQLGIARSVLRRRLQSLEAETGCELFVGNSSGVALTASGSVVAKDGRALLERSARMLAAAKSAEPRADGTVRMIIPVGMPDHVRVQLLQALRATNPELRVHEREVCDPLAHLHEPFELMFHLGPAPTEGDWFARTLRVLRLVPIASQAYLEARGRPATPEELAGHDLLNWRRPGPHPRAWPRTSGGAVWVDPVFESDSPHMLHRAAQRGLGILLGSSDPIFMADSTPLIPVLEDAIRDELAIRVLSPLPVNVDARLRAVLAGLQGFLDQVAG